MISVLHFVSSTGSVYPRWRHKQLRTVRERFQQINHFSRGQLENGPRINMDAEEPSNVPKKVFKILDTRLRRQLRLIEAHSDAFDQDGTVITSDPIQKTVLRAFEKSQELLNQWENEMAKQSLYEAFRQLRNLDYEDDLLKRTNTEFASFHQRAADCSVALNRICRAGKEDDGQPQVGHVAMIEGVPHRSMRYQRGKYGLPIMPDPRKNPLIFVKIRNAETNGYNKTTEVMGMPDSGTNRNLCSVKFTEENGLVVNNNDTVKMYAANKLPLTCMGVTKIFLKYFKIEQQITVYVMKELSDEYIMIDKATCQKLQILPQEYPLPLYMCNMSKMKAPQNQDFRTRRQQTMGIQRIPEITHSSHQNIGQRKRRETKQESGGGPKAKVANMMSCAINEKTEKNIINVTASFSDDQDKMCALQKLNKLLKQYSYVFNITAKKRI